MERTRKEPNIWHFDCKAMGAATDDTFLIEAKTGKSIPVMNSQMKRMSSILGVIILRLKIFRTGWHAWVHQNDQFIQKEGHCPKDNSGSIFLESWQTRKDTRHSDKMKTICTSLNVTTGNQEHNPHPKRLAYFIMTYIWNHSEGFNFAIVIILWRLGLGYSNSYTQLWGKTNMTPPLFPQFPVYFRSTPISCAIGWQWVQGLPRRLPQVGWDWLQHAHDRREEKAAQIKVLQFVWIHMIMTTQTSHNGWI